MQLLATPPCHASAKAVWCLNSVLHVWFTSSPIVSFPPVLHPLLPSQSEYNAIRSGLKDVAQQQLQLRLPRPHVAPCAVDATRNCAASPPSIQVQLTMVAHPLFSPSSSFMPDSCSVAEFGTDMIHSPAATQRHHSVQLRHEQQQQQQQQQQQRQGGEKGRNVCDYGISHCSDGNGEEEEKEEKAAANCLGSLHQVPNRRTRPRSKHGRDDAGRHMSIKVTSRVDGAFETALSSAAVRGRSESAKVVDKEGVRKAGMHELGATSSREASSSLEGERMVLCLVNDISDVAGKVRGLVGNVRLDRYSL